MAIKKDCKTQDDAFAVMENKKKPEMWKCKAESVERSLKSDGDYSVMTSASDEALIPVNEHRVPHLKMSG